MSIAKRPHFESLAAFCIRYDYVGAVWDGTEITCFTWNRGSLSTSVSGMILFENDFLMHHSTASLNEEAQKELDQWDGLEETFAQEEVLPFGYGFVSVI